MAVVQRRATCAARAHAPSSSRAPSEPPTPRIAARGRLVFSRSGAQRFASFHASEVTPEPTRPQLWDGSVHRRDDGGQVHPRRRLPSHRRNTGGVHPDVLCRPTSTTMTRTTSFSGRTTTRFPPRSRSPTTTPTDWLDTRPLRDPDQRRRRRSHRRPRRRSPTSRRTPRSAPILAVVTGYAWDFTRHDPLGLAHRHSRTSDLFETRRPGHSSPIPSRLMLGKQRPDQRAARRRCSTRSL